RCQPPPHHQQPPCCRTIASGQHLSSTRKHLDRLHHAINSDVSIGSHHADATTTTHTKPHAAINVVITNRVSSTEQSKIVAEPPPQASSLKHHCLRSHPNSMDAAPPSSILHKPWKLAPSHNLQTKNPELHHPEKPINLCRQHWIGVWVWCIGR
ncbi:hypothetical protein V8G54_022951, partial [Vigna mungo]